MFNNLTPFQIKALQNFDPELKTCIDYMIKVWLDKPIKEMFSLEYTSIESLCDYFEVDPANFKRILRNNGILDMNDNPTEYGIKTGLVLRTPFGNPEMN